jgi:hypothetical protein
LRLLRWLGPLLTLLLVAAAALASLFGPAAVERLAGSIPFIAAAGLLAVLGAWVGIAGLIRRPQRNVASALIHLGLALGIAGVAVNQHWSAAGYLFLESGAGPANAYLSRDFATLEILETPLALDSLAGHTARGFRPAVVAFLGTAAGSHPAGYNRPFRVGDLEVVYQGTADPGFLREYELNVNDESYLLLHNQRVSLRDGRSLWSFAVDPAERKVGLALGSRQVWLSPDAPVTEDSTRLELVDLSLSTTTGALFVVRDSRLRPLIFAGFGLALLGLLLAALRRRVP